jgi:glycosyltransferase involved in cell wall biosynthesis
LADPELSFIRVEEVKVNRGYGYGIMSGLRAARGEFLAWTHADMQTDPGDVLKGLAKILSSRDPQNVYLKGRRLARNPLDSFFTFGMSVVSSSCLGLWLYDINAQPKMFSRRFFETFAAPPDDFAFEVYVYYLARKQGREILTIPVSFADRRHGQAKGGGTLAGKWRLTRRTLSYILRLRGDLKKRRA